MTLRVTDDSTGDVHVLSDAQQLGAHLPQQFASQYPTLAGVVFEVTSEGQRGISDVRVGWDPTGGAEIELGHNSDR